jgi:hypothetical protein
LGPRRPTRSVVTVVEAIIIFFLIGRSGVLWNFVSHNFYGYADQLLACRPGRPACQMIHDKALLTMHRSSETIGAIAAALAKAGPLSISVRF